MFLSPDDPVTSPHPRSNARCSHGAPEGLRACGPGGLCCFGQLWAGDAASDSARRVDSVCEEVAVATIICAIGTQEMLTEMVAKSLEELQRTECWPVAMAIVTVTKSVAFVAKPKDPRGMPK
jgi:hypothetical protein